MNVRDDGSGFEGLGRAEQSALLGRFAFGGGHRHGDPALGDREPLVELISGNALPGARGGIHEIVGRVNVGGILIVDGAVEAAVRKRENSRRDGLRIGVVDQALRHDLGMVHRDQLLGLLAVLDVSERPVLLRPADRDFAEGHVLDLPTVFLVGRLVLDHFPVGLFGPELVLREIAGGLRGGRELDEVALHFASNVRPRAAIGALVQEPEVREVVLAAELQFLDMVDVEQGAIALPVPDRKQDLVRFRQLVLRSDQHQVLARRFRILEP